MKRRWAISLLLTISAAASSLALAAWARSHWQGEEVHFVVRRAPSGPRAIDVWTVAHGGGDLVVLYWQGSSNRTPIGGGWYGRLASGPLRNMLPVYIHGVAGYGVGTDIPVVGISRYLAATPAQRVTPSPGVT